MASCTIEDERPVCWLVRDTLRYEGAASMGSMVGVVHWIRLDADAIPAKAFVEEIRVDEFLVMVGPAVNIIALLSPDGIIEK